MTERGRPVARLVPIKAQAGNERERLLEMERSGEVRTGSGRVPRDFWEISRPKDDEGRVRSAVTEEREDGW